MTSKTESSPSPFKNEDGTYYKVVKLKTGEFILCSMSKNVTSIANEGYLTLQYPILAVLSKQMTKDENVVGEMFLLRPWVGLSNSSEFVIPTDIVLTLGDLKNPVKSQYIHHLNESLRAERILQQEEDEAEVNRAIFRLLSEVGGGKVNIMRDDDD